MNTTEPGVAKQRAATWIVGTGIAAISLAMVLGPFFAPTGFHWVRHSTSEQAAQHSPGAWIMQAGFVAYGLGVIVAVAWDWGRRQVVRAALAAFGMGLIATAVWSHAPIVPEAPADMFEDLLHSVASGVVGVAFAAACAARLFLSRGWKRDWLAWVGLVISIVIPLAMSIWPDVQGLLQRLMFVISFILVAQELRVVSVAPG